MRRLLLAIALSVLVHQAVPSVAQQRPPFTVHSDIAYGPAAAEHGDLLLPAAPVTGPRPAVLMIHGGGWISGSRSTNSWFAGLFASRGFVVFNIDYRLGVADEPDTHWPTQLIDAQLAVRWLRVHAAEFSIDPLRIGAVGDSAGGTLAVFLGSFDQPFRGDRSDLYPDQPCNVQAVIDQFGVMDLPAIGPSAALIVEGLFGTRVIQPAVLHNVSPLPFISRYNAPTLIVHGNRDDFVAIAQSHKLEAALQAQSVAVQFITFAGGHGYAGVSSEEIYPLFTREIDWLAGRLMPH